MTRRVDPPRRGTCWDWSITREKRTVPLPYAMVRESAGGVLQGRIPILVTSPPGRAQVTPSHAGLAVQLEVEFPIPRNASHWVGYWGGDGLTAMGRRGYSKQGRQGT